MRRLPLLLLLAACTGGGDDVVDTDVADDTDATLADDPPDAGEDFVVEVGTPLSLIGAGGTSSPRWDFGDGTKADGAEVTHVWEEPGNYVVVYSVVRADGRTATDTARVTAYLPAATRRPVASSPLWVDEAQACVVVPEGDVVTCVDTGTGTVLTRRATCDRPRSVVVPPGNGGWTLVSCEDDDRVMSLLHPSQATLDVDLGPGARPVGIVSTGEALWVALQGTGELARVHLAGPGGTFGELTRVPVGGDPRAIAVDANGVPWATRFRSIDGHGLLLSTDATIELPADPGPDSDTGNRGTPTALRAMAISPDGGTTYVGATVANDRRGLHRDGEALTISTSVRGTLRVIRDGVDRIDRRVQFDNHGDVSALALSPLGNWLWVAHQGTGTVHRLDAYTLRIAGAVPAAGHGIDALAVTPDGSTLIVHAWLDRELRAFDVSDPSVANPPLLWSAPTVDVEPLSPDVLRGKVLFHDSRDTRLAKDGYLTCATCHPDGGDDGITWDFTQRGEGLRNTISLLGHGGTAMGPVHWSGNFDEIQDFENDIRNGQGGAGLLTQTDWDLAHDVLGPAKAGRSADLDALAAYVTSLGTAPRSPFPASPEGEALFSAKGCDSCHDPEHGYTDSVLTPDPADFVRHDVGTITAVSGTRLGGPLDGLDTPTLLGVHATRPYLHDGSAPTVEAAIRAHDGGEADTSALTDEEVGALADFVRSL